MTKLFLFCVLVWTVLGETTTLNNAIRHQVIIDFKNAIVPIVSKQIEHMNLPDVHGKHFSVHSIEVSVHPITPDQVNIQFLGGSSLKLVGTSFAMHGSAKAKGKIGFISKTVGVKIDVDHVGFEIPITLRSLNEKPNILIPSMHLGLAGGHVHIHISGGFIGKLINIVVSTLKGHIVKHVSSAITSKMPGLITNKVNEVLNSLPMDIHVTSNIDMRYRYPIASYIKNDYIFTGIVGYLHPTGKPNPPPYTPKPMPEFDAHANKGVQFFFSDYIVKSALFTAQNLNLMYLNVNKVIQGHQVNMVCKTTKVPEFTFKTSIDSTGAAVCDVILDNKPEDKFGIEVELHLLLKEYIKNAVLFFSGEKLELTRIEYKTPKPIDIEWFKKAINEVVAAVLVVLNGELGQKGIPLPTIKQVDYSDIVQYVGDGFTMIGTTPVFHFTMETAT